MRKTARASFLFILIPFAVISQEKGALIWRDEFNGNRLDAKYWNAETGRGLWGNNELQAYAKRKGNLSVSDGCLVIRAQNRNGDFSSARVNTKGKASFTRGHIEARIKLPYGNGMWPAFWMMGDDIDAVGHPACGEIDIMEMVGGSDPIGGRLSDSVLYASIHKPRDDGSGIVTKTGSRELSEPLSNDFHVYGLRWTETEMTFSVDGTVYFSVDISSPDDEIFHKAYFLIFNLAVGGDWPGSPTEDTVWPQEMRVDWVRVYEIGPKG